MKSKPDRTSSGLSAPLKEGRDFYIEKGKYVFTARYLSERGYCCGSGCRHCPYEPKHRGPVTK